MSQLNTPNIFVQGTTINAAPFNVNFAAIQTAVNSIDNSNIGAAGLFASQLLPTTAGQATFGGLIGYNFLAPTASTTPLTVSGVAGQSADIFDVTLTSGGTKAFQITSTGITAVNAPLVLAPTAIAAPSGTLVFLENDSAATSGLIFNIPTGSTNGYRWLVNGGSAVPLTLSAAGQLQASGAIVAGAGSISGVLAAGDIGAARSSTTGVVAIGGAAQSARIDYNVTTLNAFTFFTTGGTYTNFSAGTYTNASDVSLKKSIAPIADSLSKINALTPVTFDWIHDGSPGIGFTAQDVQTQFPDAVSADINGILGYAPTAVLAHLVAAFQEYVSSHP